MPNNAPNTTKSEKQESPNEVVTLLKANTTLAVWLIFLAIGGGLLALYYARIGYLPDIDWKDALVYLFTASIIGGTIGLLLALSLFVPGVVWTESIIFDSLLAKYFTYDSPVKSPTDQQPLRKEICLRSIIYYLGLPFLVVSFASHWALLAGDIGFVLIALALLVITFVVMHWRFRGVSKSRKVMESTNQMPDQAEVMGRQLFKYASWFTLSVLLSQLSMYVIYRLSGRPKGSIFLILTLLCTGAVLISNHVVAFRFKDFPLQAVFAAVVAAALLLFIADRFSPLSVRLMSYYGFGGDPKFDLIISESGAKIVSGLGLSECGPRKLCAVEILSNMGDEYFLSAQGKTFTLPKAAVESRQSEDRRYIDEARR